MPQKDGVRRDESPASEQARGISIGRGQKGEYGAYEKEMSLRMIEEIQSARNCEGAASVKGWLYRRRATNMPGMLGVCQSHPKPFS